MKKFMIEGTSMADFEAKLEEIFIKCLGTLETKEEPSEEFLTTKEVADFLKVTTTTISNWKRKKILRPYRVGKKDFYSKQELLQIMRASAVRGVNRSLNNKAA
jgi:excisionase family DNA binding protein